MIMPLSDFLHLSDFKGLPLGGMAMDI